MLPTNLKRNFGNVQWRSAAFASRRAARHALPGTTAPSRVIDAICKQILEGRDKQFAFKDFALPAAAPRGDRQRPHGANAAAASTSPSRRR